MGEAGAMMLHEYESTFDKNVMLYSYSFLKVPDINFYILYVSCYVMFNNKYKTYT